MDKIYAWLTKNNRIPFALGILTFILLRKPISTLISKTIVAYGFSQIESVWANDVIFIFVFLGLLVYVMGEIKKNNSYSKIAFLNLLSIIAYLLIRSFETPWVFTPFSFTQYVKYADVFLVFVLIPGFYLIRWIKSTVKKNGYEDKSSTLVDDKPIEVKKDDKLNYQPYAKAIADKIQSSEFKKSFAIGINGQWGSGKTSFIYLIKEALNKKDVIEIDFNVWNSSSPEGIINEFFNTVQHSLKIPRSLSRLFQQYSNMLQSLNNNTVSLSLQIANTFFTNENTLESLHDEIEEYLKKTGKKIIVYIDDVDRLDENEIVQVMKLIRNTANFKNTFFIVAYDRNYVINALKQHNSYNQEEYLEKIFQMEVSLPQFKKGILRKELVEKLKKKFDSSIHTEIENVINKESDFFGKQTTLENHKILDIWISTPRDVTRLTNNLIVSFTKELEGEINIENLLFIELLYLKYPSVYEIIFKMTVDFLILTNNRRITENLHYELKKIEDGTNKNSKYETELGQYIFENKAELSVPENKISKIEILLDGIFHSKYKDSDLSIIHPSKFDRYSTGVLTDSDLSMVEFSKERASSQEDFNNQITVWVKGGLGEDVKEKLEDINDYDNKADYEKIIKAIFHLGRQPESGYRNQIFHVQFDNNKIFQKIRNHNDEISNTHYKKHGGVEGFKSFIKNLFVEAKYPYVFESTLASRIIDDMKKIPDILNDTNFISNEQDLIDINFKHYENFCSDKTKLYNHSTGYFWNLYHSCKIFEEGSDTKRIASDKAIQIAKNLIYTNTDGLLFILIQPTDTGKAKVSETAKDWFGSWENFEAEINKINPVDSKYITEFRTLFEEVKSNNYDFVKFKFEKMPIHLHNSFRL